MAPTRVPPHGGPQNSAANLSFGPAPTRKPRLIGGVFHLCFRSLFVLQHQGSRRKPL